jgi:hypothetical protein
MQIVYNADDPRTVHLKQTFYGTMDVTPQECENAWYGGKLGGDGDGKDLTHNQGT